MADLLDSSNFVNTAFDSNAFRVGAIVTESDRFLGLEPLLSRRTSTESGFSSTTETDISQNLHRVQAVDFSVSPDENLLSGDRTTTLALAARRNLAESDTTAKTQESEAGTDIVTGIRKGNSLVGHISSDFLTNSHTSSIGQIFKTKNQDNAGNTLNNARNITASLTPITYSDRIGGTDPNDYYRLSVSSQSALNLTLTGLSADADLELLNSSGVVIAHSRNWGTAPDAITRILDVGTYYIRVYPFMGANTSYNLTVSAATSNNPAFNLASGYGLVNAAAAVATAVGQPTFADVPDLGGDNWGNDMVNAPEVWARGDAGQGMIVAVIDSGVDITHPDLGANIWRNPGEIVGNAIDDDSNGYIDDIHGWNFGLGQNNNNVMPGTASESQGHGTHVAGIIAASNNGFGVTGVAYNSQIMPIRMGDINDEGIFINPGNLADAIRYAVNNGARVINMSLGWEDSPELQDALAYAASRNVITITASGNQGLAVPGNPASYATQYGISVGSVDINRSIAGFSNGAGVDSHMQHIVAPGVGIFSTLPGNSNGLSSGTSMATPYVSGVAALMLSANPNLTANQMRDILTSTATRIG